MDPKDTIAAVSLLGIHQAAMPSYHCILKDGVIHTAHF